MLVLQDLSLAYFFEKWTVRAVFIKISGSTRVSGISQNLALPCQISFPISQLLKSHLAQSQSEPQKI